VLDIAAVAIAAVGPSTVVVVVAIVAVAPALDREAAAIEVVAPATAVVVVLAIEPVVAPEALADRWVDNRP
jgi:hypothetical protein